MHDEAAIKLEMKAVECLNKMSTAEESDVRFTYYPHMMIYRIGVSDSPCGQSLWPTVYEAVNSLVDRCKEYPKDSLKPFSCLKSNSIPELMMKLDLRDM